MASSAYDAQFTNVILHHVPNKYAPMVLAAMMVYAFCLGIVSLEVFGNIHYDYRNVIRRPGWREPVKATNRIAYIVCRYSAVLFFFLAILNLTLPNADCVAFAKSVLVIWALPLFMVDLIFVQRTLALYGWNKRLVIPLGVLYVTYVAFCVYGVVEFGTGARIPNSHFCGFVTTDVSEQPHKALYIVYSTLTITLDTVILLLTAHRLVDGGLTNIYNLICKDKTSLRRDRAERKAAGQEVGEVSLPDLILRHGVGYYMVFQASRVAFLVGYYTNSADAALQILLAGIMATVGPLLAGLLFRQTAEAVNRTTNAASRNSQVVSNASSRAADAPGGASSASSPLSYSRQSEKIDENLAVKDDDSMLYARSAQGRQASVDAMSLSVAAAHYQSTPRIARAELRDARDVEAQAGLASLPVAHLAHDGGPRPVNLLGLDEEEDQVLPAFEGFAFGRTPPPS